ncbi:hypothetical protein GBZ26_07790 [Azospirillum formosense]|uniref:DnaA N-terminal domain-containing protein n=1 Tax=Azospirillum formosense TaxID=861533 RepID=A0ABX2KX28_9PROT|nr:hypothetical protein [Azospirillum formosense]MBY3755761.1 hypothetical protein [Azospirillum formosense]NUB19112.1 hypothetical protein [Azospirillum formosense]
MSEANAEFRRIVGRFQAAIRANPRLKLRDKVVAWAMLDRLDRQTFAASGELTVWDAVGVEALAADTSLCERDVVRARAALRQERVIEDVGRPAKGRPAQVRFNRAWLERREVAEAATEDTGVPDSGVLGAHERRTPAPATEDKTPAERRTPESSYPCNLGINLARAGTPAPARTREGPLAATLAAHFSAAEMRWFEGAAIELDGGSAVLWVPSAFQRDWIGARLADRLKGALGVYSLEVRVGAPPAMTPARTRPTLHAVAGGRA